MAKIIDREANCYCNGNSFFFSEIYNLLLCENFGNLSKNYFLKIKKKKTCINIVVIMDNKKKLDYGSLFVN